MAFKKTATPRKMSKTRKPLPTTGKRMSKVRTPRAKASGVTKPSEQKYRY